MTTNEIKSLYTMRDVLNMYGITVNRSGFAHCPFHEGDREPSMKVYDKDFHCFGCGAHGDIFSFVMLIDQCDFKTAYYNLGGTYKKPTFQSKLAIYRGQKKNDQRRNYAEKLKRKVKLNNTLIDIYRDYYNKSEPFSDVWCDCYNALQYQLYLHDVLSEEVEACRLLRTWTQ